MVRSSVEAPEADNTSRFGDRVLGVGRWFLAPAVEPGSLAQGLTMTVVRWLVGVMWLFNVAWKLPPTFGQADRSGLFVFTSYAVSNPVFPPYSWVIEHVILPQFVVFGWGVVVSETLLAVLLLSGSYVRVAAVLGVVQSVAIGLSVARAPHEWPWSYLLMVMVHLLLLFGGAGRLLAVDALRARIVDGVWLARFWGGLSTLMGMVAIVLAAGSPLGPNGANLHLPGLEFGLGNYNVLGAVILVLAGLGLLAWSFTPTRGSRRSLCWGAAAVSGLAGVLLRVQIGFSPPVLGGTGSSVAFFLTVAVVAASLALRSPAVADDPVERRSP